MIPLPSSNELLGKSISVSCRKNITSIYTSWTLFSPNKTHIISRFT
jgi:hypothetical protein